MFIGDKYDKNLTMAQITKLIKKDLQKYFGKDFKCSVRKNEYSNIVINVLNIPNSIKENESEEDLTNRIYDIAYQYRKDDSKVEYDNFDTNFRVSVNVYAR